MLNFKFAAIFLMVLSLSAFAFAADETPTEPMAPEVKEPTASEELGESSFLETEKRGLTFWKVNIDPKAASIQQFPEYYRQFINTLNAGIKLKRFNIFDMSNASKDQSQFMNQLHQFYDTNLRKIVMERVLERGKGYEDEARATILKKQMFEQVLDSAYVWSITIKEFRMKLEKVVKKVKKQQPDGTFKEIEVIHRYWRGKIEWKIDFWKFLMKEDLPPQMKKLNDTIRDVGSASNEILPLVESPQWQELKPAEKQNRILMVRNNTWNNIAPSAGAIEKKTKKIFIYIAKIVSRVDQNVYARPGKAEGMRVDDGFFVIDSNQKEMGYTKIRHLGSGYKAAGKGATTAMQDQSILQIIMGEESDIYAGLSLKENPMQGYEFDISFGYNLLVGFTNDEGQFTYIDDDHNEFNFPETEGATSLTLQFLYDMGRDIEVPEMWIGLDLNLAFGEVAFGFIDLVLVKRIYIKQLNIEFGGGFGGFFASMSDDDTDASVFAPGFTAKVCAGVGYFISPSFEIFARLDVRFVFATLSEFEYEGETYLPGDEDDEITFNVVAPAIEFGIRILF
ncbi:MAG: hypothetical protein K8S87_08405 [Planctomycetes bacterium]|nr:hypothetical protein [Planctomycetota bacterium]